ncbi:MAG TPA: SigE family RNA polymerase sigma factor [Mycobacteriales bacterium]|nr:SigE family RNA polymerase sigma factor [Mycobacteriales bacterium]
MTSGDEAGVVADAAAQFAMFVNSRGPALQRTAYLLTGDWGLAEDLLQTALAKSYLAWNRIRHDDPEGYVRKVLANTHATWWRRKWRGETPTAELPEGVRADHGAEDRMALAGALARLPHRQRAVIVLRFHEDLTESAVARVLGITVGTVKSQTAKALAKLRDDPALRPENGS